MRMLIRAEAVVDLDAASGTTAFTMKAPGAGFINVKEVFGRLEEAIASGGFSSAAGVASLELGGTEVATYSTGVAPSAGAIGDTVKLTVDEADVTSSNGVYKVAKNDTIVLKTKTQGTGGTVTGTVRFYIPMDLDLDTP